MKKLIKRILGIGLTLVLAGGIPTAASEPVSILANINPSLEEFLFEGVPKSWGFIGNTSAEVNLKQGTEAIPAHDGSYYINLPKYDESVQMQGFALEANTNYTLSFWAKSSVNNSGFIDLRYYIDGIKYNVYCNDNYEPFLFGEHLYQPYFGTEKPAPAAGEEDMRMAWEKVSFNFTTPPLAESAVLTLSNRSESGDPYLCVDDFSMVATGDVPNLINNGRLAALEGNVPTNWEIGAIDGSKSWELLNDETGTPYIKTGSDGKPVALFTNVRLHGGRYKLSFDYKNDDSAGYAPSVYMKDFGEWRYLQSVGHKGVWQTYEMYFDTPEEGYIISDFRVSLSWGVAYVKNIVLQRDYSNVEFGKKEVRQRPYAETSGTLHTEEFYQPITAIDGGELKDGSYTILPKAHYIPKTNEEEKFTLITAVYKMNGTKKELQTVSFANGTATDGVVSNIQDSVTVPNDDKNTYLVKSYIWSSATSNKSLCAAEMLVNH